MPATLEHRTTKTVTKGSHYPLGATPTRDGVNFAVYSRHASDAFLLLFDEADGEPTDVIRLQDRDKFVWHAHVQGLRPGQLYGYKIRGDYRPEWGLRFNDAKLLLDPYAKAVTGKFRNVDNLLLPYDARPGSDDRRPDPRDDAAIVPKAIVVDDAFDWQGATSPDLALEQLVIYEVHVKGFTAHPSSGVAHPGTYLGFIEKIPYLTSLGVNAVELLPIHEYYVDDFLLHRGSTNYWGYADRDRTPEGVASLALATTPSGDGKIALQARGQNLGAATVPLALPVRAQLQGAHGVCWETRVTAASVQRNDGGKFSGRDAF